MSTEAERVVAWLGTAEGLEWSRDMHAPVRLSRVPGKQGLFGEIAPQPEGLFSVDLERLGGPDAHDPGERPGDPDPMPGTGQQARAAQATDGVASPGTPDDLHAEIHQEWLEDLGHDW